MRSKHAMVMAFAATVLLATACSSSGPEDARPIAPHLTSSTPPPVAPSSTKPPAAAKARAEALAAYRGMWSDFVDAGHTSDWRSPRLAHHATGVALTNLTRGLYADHYNGLVTQGAPTLAPTVTSSEPAANPKKIVISDCGDSTHWLKYRADNGQLADREPGGRQAINAIVEKQSDGYWKVSDFGVHDVGTC
jgi:hypothetical protein